MTSNIHIDYTTEPVIQANAVGVVIEKRRKLWD